jgi:hypothetical protein
MLKAAIEKIIYKEQNKGVTFLEMLEVKNYMRYIVTACVTFLRFNLFNEMIMFYGKDASISFMIILILNVFGSLIFGYTVKKAFKGREVKFYIIIAVFTIPVDIMVIVCRYLEMHTTMSFTITVFGGFISFVMQFIGSIVFPIELGKVELLAVNKKVFGMVICSAFFCSYAFFVMIFDPLSHLNSFKTVCHHYMLVTIVVALLSVMTIFIMYPIAKSQRKEIRFLKKQSSRKSNSKSLFNNLSSSSSGKGNRAKGPLLV